MVFIEAGDKTIFETIKYPAGELQVRVRPEARLSEDTGVVIRGASAEILMQGKLAANAAYHVTDKVPALILPYLPYGRADRPFTPRDCFGLRCFLAGMEVDRDLPHVYTLDAHSEAGEKLYWDRFHNISAEPIIQRAVQFAGQAYDQDVQILLPDAGAAARYGRMFEVGRDISYATKKRNAETGKFEGFDVPLLDPDIPVLIVDDLCDGGGTYLGILEALTFQGISEASLHVTHGIFSNNAIQRLRNAGFKTITCTDSFPFESLPWPDYQPDMIFAALPVIAEAIK